MNRNHLLCGLLLAAACGGGGKKPTTTTDVTDNGGIDTGGGTDTGGGANDPGYAARKAFNNPGGMWMPRQMNHPTHAAALQSMGVKIPAAELHAAQKVNPGEHEIRASSPGRASAAEKTTLTEGQTSTLTLTLLVARDPPSRAVPPALVYTSLGLGAAGILVGSITGVVSLNSVAAAKKLCAADGACPPAAQPDLDRSLTMANISNVAFGAGIVFAGLGVVGLVLTPRAAAPPSAGAVLVPLSGGAAIRGWF